MDGGTIGKSNHLLRGTAVVGQLPLVGRTDLREGRPRAVADEQQEVPSSRAVAGKIDDDVAIRLPGGKSTLTARSQEDGCGAPTAARTARSIGRRFDPTRETASPDAVVCIIVIAQPDYGTPNGESRVVLAANVRTLVCRCVHQRIPQPKFFKR
jgi:hypothetical protein